MGLGAELRQLKSLRRNLSGQAEAAKRISQEARVVYIRSVKEVKAIEKRLRICQKSIDSIDFSKYETAQHLEQPSEKDPNCVLCGTDIRHEH